MNPDVAAWQLDMFGDPSPSHITQPPRASGQTSRSGRHAWSESAIDQITTALYFLACDSRREDRMPEALRDCSLMLNARLANRKVDTADYRATLGWIFGYWDGAISYVDVCGHFPIEPGVMRDVILTSPLLKRDLDELRHLCFGTLV